MSVFRLLSGPPAAGTATASRLPPRLAIFSIINSSVQRLVCTLCVWLNFEDFPGQAKCHDEPHLVPFRRGSFCSAHVQALRTLAAAEGQSSSTRLQQP